MSVSSANSQLTRRDFLIASLLPVVVLGMPDKAWGETPYEGDDDNRWSISVTDDTIAVLDNTTGESVFAQLDHVTKSAEITYSNGTVSQAYIDDDGTLYVDDRIVLESDTYAPSISVYSVPSGYIPLVTHRYSASTYDAYINTTSFIAQILVDLGLSALVPGFGGAIASAVAGQLVEMYYNGLPRGYVELRQYYNPNTYYVYTVVSLYRNSNYTGLVKRWEYGPTRPV